MKFATTEMIFRNAQYRSSGFKYFILRSYFINSNNLVDTDAARSYIGNKLGVRENHIIHCELKNHVYVAPNPLGAYEHEFEFAYICDDDTTALSERFDGCLVKDLNRKWIDEHST